MSMITVLDTIFISLRSLNNKHGLIYLFNQIDNVQFDCYITFIYNNVKFLANYSYNVIIKIYEEGAITPEYWEEMFRKSAFAKGYCETK